jgi:hypothetical protein
MWIQTNFTVTVVEVISETHRFLSERKFVLILICKRRHGKVFGCLVRRSVFSWLLYLCDWRCPGFTQLLPVQINGKIPAAYNSECRYKTKDKTSRLHVAIPGEYFCNPLGQFLLNLAKEANAIAGRVYAVVLFANLLKLVYFECLMIYTLGYRTYMMIHNTAWKFVTIKVVQ